MIRRDGDGQLLGKGCGTIAGCHCSLLWLRGRMTAKFGGMKVVTLQGVIVVCYGCGKGNNQVEFFLFEICSK